MLKTKVIVIPKEPKWGRDQGKGFFLTEMPADQAEKWAIRAFLALKGSESQIPENLTQLGMVGVAIVTLNVILKAAPRFEDVSPLLDEMMTCVEVIPDQSNINTKRKPIPGEIEEVTTLGWLRSQVLDLHTGFDIADALSKLISEILTAVTSLNTSTSHR